MVLSLNTVKRTDSVGGVPVPVDKVIVRCYNISIYCIIKLAVQSHYAQLRHRSGGSLFQKKNLMNVSYDGHFYLVTLDYCFFSRKMNVFITNINEVHQRPFFLKKNLIFVRPGYC